MNDKYSIDTMLYEHREHLGALAIKTHIVKLGHIDFCLKPTRDLSGWDNKLLRETERPREQIGKTGLIRGQSCHQISQLNSQKMSTKSWWIKIRRTVGPNY